MNKTFATILDSYLTHKVQAKKLNGYYFNVMNNNVELGNTIDQAHKDILVRDQHNHTNITIINYFDMGNGFKSFDDREWYYVVCNKNESDYVDIRLDLIESWQEKNANDSVIIVNQNGSVWELPMQSFYTMESEIVWNDEGNIVKRFLLDRPTYTCNPEIMANREMVVRLIKSWQFLGHTTYTKFRSGNKFLVASYDRNGNIIKYHYMKSVRQMYAILNMSNYSLRTFQRKCQGDFVEMTLENDNGKTFYITNLLTTLPPETVEMSVKPTELKETVVEIKGEKAQEIYETIIETAKVTPSNATKRVERLQEYSKKTRTIRHEPMVAKSFGQVPNAFAALCDTKPKRIIVRG